MLLNQWRNTHALQHCKQPRAFIDASSASARFKVAPCRAQRRDKLGLVNDDDAFWFSLGDSEAGTDVEKEPARRGNMEQIVFTQTRWKNHRSTQRYLRHMYGIFGGTTFATLFVPLSYLTANAILLAIYQTVAENPGALSLPPGLDLPILRLGIWPVELTIFALSLLLVLRTEAAYARWGEAMDSWGEVKHITKELVRNAYLWVKDRNLQIMLVKWTVAFIIGLEIYVHGYIEDEITLPSGAKFSARLNDLLLPHECESFLKAGLSPHYPLHVLTEVVRIANLPGQSREYVLLGAISSMNVALGTCEKLLRFPIPINYTRHTSRFMLLWLTFLPLSLWDEFSWSMVPLTMIMSFLLLGIEQIGVQIEEPFSSLPISDISADILSDIMNWRMDVSQLVDASVLPEYAINPLDQILDKRNSNSNPGFF